MDNLSQASEKKEEVTDIQFEEVFDLEAIQKKLQESIEKGDLDVEPEEVPIVEEVAVEQKPLPVAKPKEKTVKDKIDSNAKKYVVYIDPNNVDFMESLSQNERRDVINKILKEQNELSLEQRENNKKLDFLKHALLACFTFILFFPIMFIGVNKALESTITNYQQAKQNFGRLYKEQGKIKMQDSVGGL